MQLTLFSLTPSVVFGFADTHLYLVNQSQSGQLSLVVFFPPYGNAKYTAGLQTQSNKHSDEIKPVLRTGRSLLHPYPRRPLYSMQGAQNLEVLWRI